MIKSALPAFGSKLKTVEQVTPCMNVGSIFDVPNGVLRKGKWDNILIDGGAWRIVGIMGPNNSFKSTLSKYFTMALLNNYQGSNGLTLDTEVSGTGYQRYVELSNEFENLTEEDFSAGSRWVYTTNAQMYGDEFWTAVRDYEETKTDKQNIKSITYTLPWIVSAAKPEYAKYLLPTAVEIDSISQFSVKSIEDKLEDEGIGSKKRNMEDMDNGRAKSKMVKEMPVTTARGALYVTMTAHVGKEFNLELYTQPVKKFQNQANGLTAKGIPEAFGYNVNVLYEIIKAVPLLNRTTKEAEFPISADIDYLDNTDLMEIFVNITRGKAGGTGFKFSLLASQARGLLVGLTDLWFLKQNGNFGIGGNNVNMRLDLCPDISFTRITARQKIDEYPELRRALRFTVDLLVAQRTKKIPCADVPLEDIVTPAKLYEGLKEKGYDWNELYDTINEWQYLEYEQDKPTLTVFDLLRMNAGKYQPYWKNPEWLKLKRKSFAP